MNDGNILEVWLDDFSIKDAYTIRKGKRLPEVDLSRKVPIISDTPIPVNSRTQSFATDSKTSDCGDSVSRKIGIIRRTKCPDPTEAGLDRLAEGLGVKMRSE